MVIYRFRHPQRYEDSWDWDTDSKILSRALERKQQKLDPNSQIGSLLFRFLEFCWINRYGLPQKLRTGDDFSIVWDEIEVKAYIPRLLKKLEISKDDKPIFIKNLRGIGYYWNIPVERSQDGLSFSLRKAEELKWTTIPASSRKNTTTVKQEAEYRGEVKTVYLPLEKDSLVNQWRQFENWLSGRDAPIWSGETLVDNYRLAIIAREWFRLFNPAAYWDFDEEPFQIPGFVFHEKGKTSFWSSLLCLDEEGSEDLVEGFYHRPAAQCVFPHVLALAYQTEKGLQLAKLWMKKLESAKDGRFFFLLLRLPVTKPEVCTAKTSFQWDERKAIAVPEWLPESYPENVLELCEKLDPLIHKSHIYGISIHHAVRMTLKKGGMGNILNVDDLDEYVFERPIIVTGPGGIGKTTLAKQFLSRQLGKENLIPVFLPLRRYRAGTLLELLCSIGLFKMESFSSLQELCSKMQNCNWLIVMDGYDELADKEAFWGEWQVLSIPRLFLMITSRFEEDLEFRVSGAWVLSVRPLDPSQMKEMLVKYERSNHTKLLHFIQHRNLEKEARIPLWLLFIMLVHKVKGRGIEASYRTKGRLFQSLIENYYLSWERDKGIYKIPSITKSHFLGAVAFAMVRDGRVSIRSHDLLLIFDQQRKSLASHEFEHMLSELLRHELLIEEGSEFYFPHKSFLEYFAGVYLTLVLSIQNFPEFYNRDWFESLKYCIGLLPLKRGAEVLGAFFDSEKWIGTIDGLGQQDFLTLLFEIDGFQAEKELPISAVRFKGKLKDYLSSLWKTDLHLKNSNAWLWRKRLELGIGISRLFPARQSLDMLALFFQESQHFQIETIDVIGKIWDKRAAELLLDKAMGSPDERILRRAVDNGIRLYLSGPSEFAQHVENLVWSRVNDCFPEHLSTHQYKKRLWHLIHVLEQFYSPGLEERLNFPGQEMQDVCTALLIQRQNPNRMLHFLCKSIGGRDRVCHKTLKQVFSHLLASEDFFIRRGGAHLLRYVTFDFHNEAQLALNDNAIEVRFSALKSVIHLATFFPEYARLCIDWLVEAIKTHHEPEEEHFRQVALGAIKCIDYNLFMPLAFQFLYSDFPTFRVDIVHDLKNATGFWREVVLVHLSKIVCDSKEPEALRKAAQHVLDLLS